MTRLSSRHAAMRCSVVATLAVVACSCFDYDECPENRLCVAAGTGASSSSSGSASSTTTSSSSATSSGSGGADAGDGGDGAPPASCDPAVDPSVVADTCGVFVSPTGDDGAAGTKEKPLKTLTAALAKGTTIYACAGATPYSEAVSVTTPATIYGALDCTSWAYVPATKTALTAPADAIPLTVSNGAGSTAVYDFAITAADAVTPGGSSIAVLDDGATLSMTRCSLTAGKGEAGSTGLTATGAGATGADAPAPVPATALDGCVAGQTGVFGGQPGTTMCGSVVTNGGSGGNGQNLTTGGPGVDAPPQPQPNTMAGADGVGGKAQDSTPCLAGDNGANGINGATPGLGATGIGAVSSTGYQAPSATAGGPGGPGYGGGGGGGASQCANGFAGPAGGGGGAGGCGGQGGGPGQSGGSSFALVSVSAMVSLDSVTLTTAAGGAGGAGGNHQKGGQGGNGGPAGSSNGDGSVKACAGGSGGQGGAGSPGGGGLGGHSAGIAFTGTAPVQMQVTIMHAGGGAGGVGGDMNMTAGVVGGAGLGCSTLDFMGGSASCAM